MKVGQRFKVRDDAKALPSVRQRAGQKGLVVQRVKYGDAPLIAKMDDGGTWFCWPAELEKI